MNEKQEIIKLKLDSIFVDKKIVTVNLLIKSRTNWGKISAQSHTTLCIQFLRKENSVKRNILTLQVQLCFGMIWGYTEMFPKLDNIFAHWSSAVIFSLICSNKLAGYDPIKNHCLGIQTVSERGGRENFAFKFCSKEKREYFKKGNLMNCAGSRRRGNIPILYTIDSAITLY